MQGNSARLFFIFVFLSSSVQGTETLRVFLFLLGALREHLTRPVGLTFSRGGVKSRDWT